MLIWQYLLSIAKLKIEAVIIDVSLSYYIDKMVGSTLAMQPRSSTTLPRSSTTLPHPGHGRDGRHSYLEVC